MKATFVLAAVVAVVSSTLAILINIATDLKNAWWAWAGVVVATALSALITFLVQTRRSDLEAPSSASEGGNIISGSVGGDVVQAGDINGDITFHQQDDRSS
jgi:hypothetical protein